MNILDKLMAVNVDDIPHDKVNYDQVPVRLLKSDFLERFTHVTPQAVLAIWLPVVAFFLVNGALNWPATLRRCGMWPLFSLAWRCCGPSWNMWCIASSFTFARAAGRSGS